MITAGSALNVRAQGATDIWLFELTNAAVSPVARVTDRNGYDNQPSFTDDGKRMLFTSDRTGKADTHVYDLQSGKVSRVTYSNADKYSPTIIPGSDDRHLAVVHSDSLVMQGLWRYDLDESTSPQAIADIDSVAYFAWMDPSRVLLWRLSTPPTVVVLDVESNSRYVVARDSAFSFKAYPAGNATLFLARWSGRHGEIRSFDHASLEASAIAPILEAGRDFAVTPDGRLLMMKGGALFSFRPGVDSSWTLIGELGISNGTRIAVSPDGSLIAVVGRH